MHQSVLEAFVRFSSPLEGAVASLYVDVNGKKVPPVPCVTTAIGRLVDPVTAAQSLPWVMPDGTPASRDEIARQWRIVKADAVRLSKLHWKYAAALTTMRLTEQGILDVTRQQLLANEKILRQYFPNWDRFPADAQLACCSMAWAVGAGFPHEFSNFRAAANAQNWTSAIASCAIRTEGNPGIVPRNAQNRLCLANAQAVVSGGLPLETLFWPGTVPGASQRDQALRVEAEQGAADHAAHNAALWDAATMALAAGLDLAGDREYEPYQGDGKAVS